MGSIEFLPLGILTVWNSEPLHTLFKRGEFREDLGAAFILFEDNYEASLIF